jgi:hypothetical protein
MKARAVPLKGFDQPFEQLCTLLIPEMEDVPKGIHDRIHAAQSIKVSLPVSAPASRHQPRARAGERGGVGGDDPTSAGPWTAEADGILMAGLQELQNRSGERTSI